MGVVIVEGEGAVLEGEFGASHCNQQRDAALPKLLRAGLVFFRPQAGRVYGRTGV